MEPTLPKRPEERARPVVGFDLDGTLVDLSEATRAALRAVNRVSPYPIDVDAAMADPEIPIRQQLRRWVPADALSRLLRGFADAFRSEGLALARPLPGASEALAAVRDRGHDTVVITGRNPEIARAVLSACGLPELAVAGHVVGEHKAPVMAVHGVLAYVGDHRLDMAGARRADVYAVGLAGSPQDAGPLRDAGADLILPGIAHFADWYLSERGQELLAGLRPAPRGLSRIPLSDGSDAEVRGRPEYWAAHHPDRPAVVDGETTMTYAQWDERAERLAERLARLPRAGSQRVAVRTHQRPEWFVVNLALAKLGWEHVAMSWRLTPAEVRRVVAECDPRALVLDDAEPHPVAAALAGTRLPVFSVGGAGGGTVPFATLLDGPRVERESYQATPVVLYSSGTTGRPRGVRRTPPRDALLRQQNLDDVGRARRRPGRGVNRTLLTLPLDHGAGPRAAQYCHDTGGCVYLLDRFDPVRVLELIDRHRITHWKTVPTMLSRLRNVPEEVLRGFDVSCLQAVSVGAAPFPPALKLWAVGFFGPGVVHEGYGSTEVGIVTAMPPSMISEKPASCGRPREHVTVRITTADGEPLPAGQPGHILVRSPATEGRYLEGPERPEKPDGTHGPDGPAADPAVRHDGFTDTGDLGYLDSDGYLYITGRSTDMIIVGGMNVYPVEVEQALAELDAVLEAAVIGVPDSDLGETVAAVCELRPGRRLTAAEVDRHLESRLAPYKRPRRIEFVDALPRNAMEKVRKNELRALFQAGIG